MARAVGVIAAQVAIIINDGVMAPTSLAAGVNSSTYSHASVCSALIHQFRAFLELLILQFSGKAIVIHFEGHIGKWQSRFSKALFCISGDKLWRIG